MSDPANIRSEALLRLHSERMEVTEDHVAAISSLISQQAVEIASLKLLLASLLAERAQSPGGISEPISRALQAADQMSSEVAGQIAAEFSQIEELSHSCAILARSAD